jgi:hypothetical protein
MRHAGSHARLRGQVPSPTWPGSNTEACRTRPQAAAHSSTRARKRREACAYVLRATGTLDSTQLAAGAAACMDTARLRPVPSSMRPIRNNLSPRHFGTHLYRGRSAQLSS